MGEKAKQKSPVGFFKKFVIYDQGEQMEKLDAKEKGSSHIIASVRAMAIAHNIKETSTIERLRILEKRGFISEDLMNNSVAALEFLLPPVCPVIPVVPLAFRPNLRHLRALCGSKST